MTPAISETDLEAIADRVASKVSVHGSIARAAHSDDHEWIKQRRQDEADMRAFRKKVIQSATIWAVILAIGFIGMATWKAVVAAAKTTGL